MIFVLTFEIVIDENEMYFYESAISENTNYCKGRHKLKLSLLKCTSSDTFNL